MDQALQIRRCHQCGSVTESAEEIKKCDSCGKALLPFHYFAKRNTKALQAEPVAEAEDLMFDEIEQALRDGIGPIRGLTAYW